MKTKLTLTLLTALLLAPLGGLRAAEPIRLENSKLALRFDDASGTLTAVENKLTGETYSVSGDEFAIEAVEGDIGFDRLKPVAVKLTGDTLTARYEGAGLTVEVRHRLGAGQHFVERSMWLTSDKKLGVKKIVLGRPTFTAEGLEVVSYCQPKLMNPKGQEPILTCFGRTARGGFFTGVELPFDASSQNANTVVLAYRPNLRIRAGERLDCEPAYFGVYKRNASEVPQKDLPLRSESDAMVAMTATILPPQNKYLGACLASWWSEMYRGPYRTMVDVENHMRAIDFALECGIDIIADTRVWSGEFDKVNALREGDDLHFGELALKLADYVQKKHVRWVWSPAFGNSNPWWPAYDVIGRPAPKGPTASTVFGGDLNIGVGRAYRADKPEWQMKPLRFEASMCFAHKPAYQWLTKMTLQAMEAGRYGAFGWGDDFFGQPGFGGGPGYNGGRGPNGEPPEPWVHPARCENPLHEHLDPDTNYICMRNLTAHVRLLRQRFPDLYINHARPAMDLGVWAMRYVDSSFTVNEWAALEGIKGMGPQPVNVLLGDKIRHWSRIRVHHQFFPHYIDSPQLFAAPKSMPGFGVVDWQREKLDYILLSALSCSPSQTFYLPTQAGIPAEDKREIKKWLDWGRANLDYLFIRKDLPHWPTPEKVDGSAHIAGDRGLVFLFNPNAGALSGDFALTAESIGLSGEGEFRIEQEHPVPGRTQTAHAGETIRWEVPAQTACVLRIQKLPLRSDKANASPRDWGAMADEVGQRPELAERLEAVIASARKLAATPIVKRVYHYADIGKHRTWLDGRAKFMDGQPRQQWFALAMSDFGASGTILSELPLLAFAYRCTGEEVFRARIISQLEEAVTWSPLQRPGWQLCTPAPDPVPAGYWDGSWLATGVGIRGIADTLELMPAGSVPPELMDKLRELLRAEIKTISDDWKLKRGWFRGGNGVPQTNQWVLPTEGLIRACLLLGKDRYAAEYELGVANLLRALDVQGKQGEFNEGIGYAMFTVSSMLAAAHAMAAQGDARALEHPFLRGFPTWAVHHLQPGRFRINCFDAGGARTPRNAGGTRQLLETLAVFAQSQTARWALSNLYDGPTDSLVGVLARTLRLPVEAPLCFAFYDGPAHRVNWRSSWADDADGVWVRGGHPLDGHDHFDRGHVNYIVRGKPLLIEAGTPGYDNPAIHTLYSTAVGHNVLEVEGIKPKKAPASMSVTRLDASGGDLTVDGTACYPGLKQWRRRVTWDQSQLTVEDQVGSPADKSAVMLFRWHLGTDQPAVISGKDGNWQAVWPDGTLALTSSVPVTVTQENLPDNTVCLGRKDNGWDFMHTCVVVRTGQYVSRANLTTTVRAAR